MLWLAGCGYRPLDVAHPFGAQRVALLPLDERPASNIAPHVAGHLAQALAQGGAWVETDRTRADATLGGTVTVTAEPGTTLERVQIYNLNATLTAEWRDAAGTLLWQTQVSASESYLPQAPFGLGQPLATETQRTMALLRLAERLASEVYRALSVAQWPAASGSGT